jgi:cytochrome P450
MIPVNPFDPRARADPYPVYQYMRTVEPVHRSPAGFWILTRYEDCRAVLEDARWSHDADRILEPSRAENQPVDPTVRVLRASVLFSDPPAHSQHRKVLEAATKKAVGGAREIASHTTSALLDLMDEKEGEVDLIHDFAAPLALVVVSELLGIPAADRSQMQQWSRELAVGLDPGVGARGIARAGSAAVAFVEYLLGRLDLARTAPRPGMISDVVTRPGRLNTFQLIADLVGFALTGIGACSGLIGNALLALLHSPDQLERLRADPALMATAIDEFIRFDGPIHLTARVAAVEVEVGSVPIAAGEQVIVLLGASNRDPERFSNPDRLDLARVDNPHIGFGAGIHQCIAQPLAKTVTAAALAGVLARLGTIKLSGDPVWSNTVTLRTLRKLPVTVAR